MTESPISISKDNFLEDARQPVDLEKDASAGSASTVSEDVKSDADTRGLKTTQNGKILIPQPSKDPNDPLNWSWMEKHTVLLALLLPSLLTDWGMTWGTTLFELQALTWKMSVPDAARSVSGGIFLQGPGGVLAVPFVQRFGRYGKCLVINIFTKHEQAARFVLVASLGSDYDHCCYILPKLCFFYSFPCFARLLRYSTTSYRTQHDS
jgi:hypothetical protein